MIKTSPLLLLCLLLSGCIGGGIIKSKTNPYRWYNSHSKTNAEVYTSTWLKTNYGKPTNVITNGSEEVWTYQSGRIWAGVMPVVIVPIPLAVPVGREAALFTLQDDPIVSATQIKQETIGGAVGFAGGPCGGTFGAFSLEGFPK